MICRILTTLLLLTGIPLFAQEEELELIDRISELQSTLATGEPAERDRAQQQLIELGPQILDYLEPTTKEAATDYRERLQKIRSRLEKVAADSVAQASRISATGSMTVGDLIRKIRRQTNNELTVADDSLLDIPIKVELEKSEFWPALETLLDKAKLEVDRYGGARPNQLQLTPVSNRPNRQRIPTATAKVFRVSVNRVDASTNLQQPDLDYTTVNLLVQWEPRLTPISIDIPMSKVLVTDEFGDELKLNRPNEVIYGTVQPEIPEVEFSLVLPRIDRQVENIESIKATIEAVLPGRIEQFRFTKLSKRKINDSIEKAGAKVTFEGIRKNEDLFGIKLSLSFDEDNDALESHQGWVFNNEVYLQDAQGIREQAISLETFQQDNEKVTVQYYFLEDPGDRTLVYKTASSIVKLPVEIELTRIPLP